jgi:hypothetical protein
MPHATGQTLEPLEDDSNARRYSCWVGEAGAKNHASLRTAIHPRSWTPGGCAPLDLANRAARIHQARTERIHVPDDDRADFAPLDALDPPLNSQGPKSN